MLFFQEGWTPLHVACYNSNLEITEVLLDEGADPNNPDMVTDSAPIDSERSSYNELTRIPERADPQEIGNCTRHCSGHKKARVLVGTFTTESAMTICKYVFRERCRKNSAVTWANAGLIFQKERA